MNIYRMIGSSVGTPDAQELAVRLSSWHDAMVAHERRGAHPACDEECPHVDAPVLWAEALQTFGDRAAELRFLRSRGLTTSTHAVPDGYPLELFTAADPALPPPPPTRADAGRLEGARVSGADTL